MNLQIRNTKYPFGMLIESLKHLAFGGDYAFGYNGKENDNEVKGNGNQQDYGFRIYDTRLARFLSVDPLTKQYPFYTPYQFAGNKPINSIDLDGKEDLLHIHYTDVEGNFSNSYTVTYTDVDADMRENIGLYHSLSENEMSMVPFSGGADVWIKTENGVGRVQAVMMMKPVDVIGYKNQKENGEVVLDQAAEGATYLKWTGVLLAPFDGGATYKMGSTAEDMVDGLRLIYYLKRGKEGDLDKALLYGTKLGLSRIMGKGLDDFVPNNAIKATIDEAWGANLDKVEEQAKDAIDKKASSEKSPSKSSSEKEKLEK